jgi:hypothetical protein
VRDRKASSKWRKNKPESYKRSKLRTEAKRKGLHGAQVDEYVTERFEQWRTQQPQRSSGAPIGSPTPNKQVTEEQVTKDEVTEDQVTEDQVTEEQVTEEQVTEEQVTEEQVTEDQVTVEQVAEDQVTEASEDLLPVDDGYDTTSNANDLNVSTLILNNASWIDSFNGCCGVFDIVSSQMLALRRYSLGCRRFGVTARQYQPSPNDP